MSEPTEAEPQEGADQPMTPPTTATAPADEAKAGQTIVPAPPTADEIRARQEREAAEWRRAKEDEDARQQAAAKARLEKLAKRLLEEHPNEGDHPEGDAGWTDPADAKRALYKRLWAEDLKFAHVTGLAAWRLSDVEDLRNQKIMAHYVDQLGNGPKLNLIVVGGVGAHKTSSAIAAGHAAIDKGLCVRFVTHETYLRSLRPEGEPPRAAGEPVSKEVFRRHMRAADLLILDDLGAERAVDAAATDFVRSETLSLIGDRLYDGKATIFTTNLTFEQLQQVMGDRITSRMGSKAESVVVKFEGPDAREPLTW